MRGLAGGVAEASQIDRRAGGRRNDDNPRECGSSRCPTRRRAILDLAPTGRPTGTGAAGRTGPADRPTQRRSRTNGSKTGRPTRRRSRTGGHARSGRHRPDGRTARQRRPHTRNPTPTRHPLDSRPARSQIDPRASGHGDDDHPRERGSSPCPTWRLGILALTPTGRPTGAGPAGRTGPTDSPTQRRSRTNGSTESHPARCRHRTGGQARSGRHRPDGGTAQRRRPHTGSAT